MPGRLLSTCLQNAVDADFALGSLILSVGSDGSLAPTHDQVIVPSGESGCTGVYGCGKRIPPRPQSDDPPFLMQSSEAHHSKQNKHDALDGSLSTDGSTIANLAGDSEDLTTDDSAMRTSSTVAGQPVVTADDNDVRESSAAAGQAEDEDPRREQVEEIVEKQGLKPREMIVWKCIPMQETPPDDEDIARRIGAVPLKHKSIFDKVMLRDPTPQDRHRLRPSWVVPGKPPTFDSSLMKQAPGSDDEVWRTILRDPKGADYWVTTPNHPDNEIKAENLNTGPIAQGFGYQMACQAGLQDPVSPISADLSGLAAMPELRQEALDFLFKE